MHPCHRTIWIVLILLLLVWAWPAEVLATRSATSLRSRNPERFTPPPPLSRSTVRHTLRDAVPIFTENYFEKLTQHFRILWGKDYDISDPDWADPDQNGIPTWVQVLADALERAYSIQHDAGFPDPYGMDVDGKEYYLDVYIGNTGIRVKDEKTGQWNTVTISSDYYAYTDIDPDYQVAFFVFNDDFSTHTNQEQSVLRATAAHELFHAVQRVYYPWDDDKQINDTRWKKEVWWFESTSTWMEEVCFPAVKDYVTFVKGFLNHPELPLNSTEGDREYGAAVFPGYLWNSYGQADIWKAVFKNAFKMGVDSALCAAFSGNKRPPLGDVLARFWSMAAHPADVPDVWPDGALYSDTTSPKILNGSSPLNFSFSATAYNAPGRYGANLFRFTPDGPGQTVQMILDEFNPGAAWRVGVSMAGSGTVEVWPPDTDHPKISFKADGTDDTCYISLVNVSVQSGYQQYDALFRKIPLSPVPGDLNGNGEVSLEDGVIALQILSGIAPVLGTGIQPMDYAVSGNKTIGVPDMVYILQHVSGLKINP